MSESRINLAYVLSLKGGLPSFNFREIEEVERRGVSIHLFATKMSPGLYGPKPNWNVHTPRAIKIVPAFFYWLFRRPRTLFHILGEALSDSAMPEFALTLQFSREMSRATISHIHCHFADRKMFTTYFCSELTGVPYTVTVHSHELVFYANRKLFLKSLEHAKKILTVCDYNRDALLSAVRIPAEKVVTIRLYTPLEEFKQDDRTKVLTVAKFHEYKGYDVLVKAARILSADSIVFWIVGEGPVDVRGMAADLVSKGTIKILGPVNEDVLKILYQSCDIFCLPSKTSSTGQKEGLPVSLMEAMAFSKPVVSTRHAGIPELVETVIVPEGDAEAIAAAILAYSKDPVLRRKDGERNRARVKQMHGPETLDRLVHEFVP